MPSFVLTTDAKRDLREIGRYTQQKWGKRQRNSYLRELDQQFHLLAERPNIRHRLQEIKDDLYAFPCRKHYIFYLTQDDKIVVIAILHERMEAIQRVKSRLS